MSDNQLNIKSTTIEKGLELAKDFIDKLIGPSINEVGLLFSDNIKYFRFKNQVKILLKAKKYVESKNINPKEIPLKILVPLLENASLEENEELQDKWATMITNLADSDNNLQNQIFPYILSQISIEEYNGLFELNEKEIEYYQLNGEYRDLKAKEEDKFHPSKEVQKLKQKIVDIEQNGFWLGLEHYEQSNLQRLGLIRQLPPRIQIEEFKTQSSEYTGEYEQWHQLEASYDVDDYGFRITELGEKFIEILKLKKDTTASG